MPTYTRYFTTKVVEKRPDLQLEWIERVLDNPVKVVRQKDDRLKYWGYIEEVGRILRVVTLNDGTIHNAFFDRRFRLEDIP